MSYERIFWSGVFILNSGWILVLPTVTGQSVATLGTLTALVALALNSGRTSDTAPRHSWWPQRFEGRPAALTLVLALFILPALSFVQVITFVSWRLDGRSWLIVSWLACAMVLEYMGRTDSRNDQMPRLLVSPNAALFLLWSSVFWLTVVLDLGVATVMANVDRSSPVGCESDVLTVMFSTWESNPVSRHLFLAWKSAANFAAGIAYENHAQPYLLAMYAWTSAVRATTGLPLFAASNSTALLSMAVVVAAATALMARAGILRKCRGARGFLTLFVGTGFIVTTWRFWSDLQRFNTDNHYPLLAALLILTYALLLPPTRPVSSVVAGTTFVAFSPIHLPMLLLGLGCIFGRTGRKASDVVRRNRTVLTLASSATLVGIGAMVLPRLLAWRRGYEGQGSSLIYRTGLDGSSAYFTDILQAVWSACPTCCGPRPILRLLVPAFVPLAVFFWYSRGSGEIRRLGGYGRMLLFLSVPYAVSAIFLPQSVAVHPYLYDHLLIVPVVVTGAVAMSTEPVRRKLHGPGLLLFLLFAGWLIMSNLIEIAQGLPGRNA